MMHTDKCYVRPTVYKFTTNFKDKLIQLDSWELTNNVSVSPEQTLGNTFLKPVSYVSNDAGVYSSVLEDITISPYGE